MYSTVKELHIEIEHSIQQVTSDLHLSIAPEWLDMVLNRTALTYVNTRSSNKTNYKGEGFDESQKRVDDLRSLKRYTEFLQVIKDKEEDRGYVLIPSDYLQLSRTDCKVKFSKLHKDELKDAIDVVRQGVHLDISKFNFSQADGWTRAYLVLTTNKTHTINITDLIQFLIGDYDEPIDLYEFIELLIDRIRYNGFNAYWEHFDGHYIKDTIIILGQNDIKSAELRVYQNLAMEVDSEDSLSDDIDPFENTGRNGVEKGECIIYPGVSRFKFDTPEQRLTVTGNKIVSADLVPSDQIRNVLGNSYTNLNRHMVPILELVHDRLFVYFGDHFVISHIRIDYIKRPTLFNHKIKQMSDLQVTPEFMQMVISNVLLSIKDGTYQNYQQQSNLE